MIQTLKQHRILFSLLTIFFGFMLVVGTVRVDYSFSAPGYNDNVDQFLTIETDYNASGSFHTTSVIVMDKVSILQYFTGKMMAKVEIRDFPRGYEGIDLEDLTVMGYLQKDDSLSTALIVAIENAGLDITYDSYDTVYLTYAHMTDNTLEVGDRIISVNNSTDYYEELTGTACYDSAEIVIERNDTNHTFTITRNLVDQTNPEGTCSFGLYIDILSEIVESDVEYSITRTGTQGPSGGLLQTLYIFNELTEFDYTNGLKIAGTGTIDVHGNVGYIGSMRQKIITAISNDIDVFFAPHLNDEDYDNYIEALSVLEEFNTDMIVVGVSTFAEAVEFLENYGDTYE